MAIISKSFLVFFLVLCSCAFVGFSQGDSLPCVQKLLPCQPYMKSPSPPASCCVPLKQLIADDTQCLCAVINNPGILKSLNITKTDAVNLAKNCGANADLSVCNKMVPPPGSSTTPSPPSNGSMAKTPPSSAVNVVISNVGRCMNLVAAAFLSFIIV